jgi:hypothetical protein
MEHSQDLQQVLTSRVSEGELQVSCRHRNKSVSLPKLQPEVPYMSECWCRAAADGWLSMD